jgi:ankyrin repeat protein
MLSPSLTQHRNDCDQDDEHLQDIIECRRLLLVAGADPTLPDSEGKTNLSDCVVNGIVVRTCTLDFVLAVAEPTRPH